MNNCNELNLLTLLEEKYSLDEDIEEYFQWYLDDDGYLKDYSHMKLYNFMSDIFSNSMDFSDIIEDIKIKMLESSLEELQLFFNSKRNQKKYALIFDELFYNEHQIYDVVSNAGIALGFWEKDNIPFKVFEIHNLNVQIPKVKLLWAVFILATNTDKECNDLKKLIHKDLMLKWTKNKDLIEVEKFRIIQGKFILFMKAVCLKMLDNKDDTEIALSLFSFNKASLLLDLTLIAKNKEFNINKNSNLVNINKIQGFSTKHNIITTNFGIDELLLDGNIDALNQIFNRCESLLESLMTSLNESENTGLPESISTAYVKYKYLNGNVYYNTKALSAFVISDNIDFNITSEELERYGRSYKAFYKIMNDK